MSRCLPYPPPGCVRHGIREEAMIESIQRETERAKKERKRDKRRKKKEKKENENGEAENKKHHHKLRHKDDGNLADEKGEYIKKRKLNSELAERSNLTEEHGKPINSQNSSDSTLNNNQMRKPDFLPEAGQNTASFIRIRLPLQRHRDPEVIPKGEPSCSTLVRTDIFAPEKHVHALRSNPVSGGHLSASSIRSGQELAIKHGRREVHLSGANDISTSGNELLTVPELEQHRPSSSELRCINLIENWAPPQYQTSSVDIDDENWLFEGKQKPCPHTDICKVEHDCLVCTSSTTWPVSHFLPELGIYALPYTVPY